jgi:hypothetical protein
VENELSPIQHPNYTDHRHRSQLLALSDEINIVSSAPGRFLDVSDFSSYLNYLILSGGRKLVPSQT